MRNEQGLTLQEWVAGARYPQGYDPEKDMPPSKIEIHGWINGEDVAEYAVLFNKENP